jgi:hypothetical protein
MSSLVLIYLFTLQPLLGYDIAVYHVYNPDDVSVSLLTFFEQCMRFVKSRIYSYVSGNIKYLPLMLGML